MIIYAEGVVNDATLIFINQFLFLCLQSKKILSEFFIKSAENRGDKISRVLFVK